MVHGTAKVKLSGELKEVATDTLVPGDIVYIQEGDSVPTDLRLFQEMNLQSNDFALTGESNPQRKHTHQIDGLAELGDRTNMAFMGTTIATGDGRGIVVHTGERTELGKIANLTHDTANELSPLQIELNHTSKILTIGALILGGGLFVLALQMNMTVHAAILFALGIASSMVPQGLPSQISVALTSASARLAEMNALVKKLSAVETIGAINVICTDKTGTLTKNEMTVQNVLIGKQLYDVTGDGYEPIGTLVGKDARPVAIDDMKQLFFSI
jgi:P-type Ca2+ transporter type 2C